MTVLGMAQCSTRMRIPTIGEQWGPYRVKARVGMYGVELECAVGHTVRRTIDERNQVKSTKQCGECRKLERAEKAKAVEKKPPRFGCYELVRLSERTYTNSNGIGGERTQHYRVVRCVKCGAELERTKEDVFKARRENKPGCTNCTPRTYALPPRPKRCPWCQDMAWARPEDGKPCKCGKFYEREAMAVQAPTATSAMGEM